MAEICCDVAGKAADAVSPTATRAEIASCKASSRHARRRRIQNRRFRIVQLADGTVSTSSAEGGVKRRRLESSLPVHSAVEVHSEEAAKNSELEQARGVVTGTAADGRVMYGMISVCGRRRDMEDAVSIRPDFLRQDPRFAGKYNFFGIYDGHGCSHVATACQNRMHEIVAEEMLAVHAGPSPPPETWWRSAMQRSYRRMDTAVDGLNSGERTNPGCRCELLTPNCSRAGSTAVVAVIESRQIVIGNCGDSRAVLCRNGVAVPLSSDHKPDRPDELRRIEAAGGRVIYWDGARVFGMLAMSRAIGDSYLKPFVIPEPEVTVTERTDEDECLILASDGLWDVMSNEMACNVARMCLRSSESPLQRQLGGGGEEGEEDEVGRAPDRVCSDAAKLLVQLAIARQSADNVSVVVIDLRRRRL